MIKHNAELKKKDARIDELQSLLSTRDEDAVDGKEMALTMFDRMCNLHETYIGQIDELNQRI